MAWVENLQARLRTHKMAAIARDIGVRETRIPELLKKKGVPNVLDAILICRALNTTVEDVFGQDASEKQAASLKNAAKARKRVGTAADAVVDAQAAAQAELQATPSIRRKVGR